MSFDEHGTFTIDVNGNTLFVEAEGPFNIETVRHYRDDLQVCLDAIKGRPFNQIIVFHNQSIFTQEAADMLVGSNKEMLDMGLEICVIVLFECEYKRVVTRQMSEIYEKSGIPYRFFDSVIDAKLWLEQAPPEQGSTHVPTT